MQRLTTMEPRRRSVKGEPTITQRAVPSKRNVATTTTRRSRSAMPGSPVGNIENSLSTIERVTCRCDATNLQSRDVQLLFRRGTHPPELPYSSVEKTETSCLPRGTMQQMLRFSAHTLFLAIKFLCCRYDSDDSQRNRRLRRRWSVVHGLRARAFLASTEERTTR